MFYASQEFIICLREGDSGSGNIVGDYTLFHSVGRDCKSAPAQDPGGAFLFNCRFAPLPLVGYLKARQIPDHIQVD